MYRFWFLVILTVQMTFCCAQSIVTIGKAYPVVDAGKREYFSENDEILAVKVVSRRIFFLQKMNAKTLEILSVRSYEDFPRGFQTESIRKVGSRYYVFYSLFESRQKLFAREIDFASGEFKETSEIADISGGNGEFTIFASSDGSALVAAYNTKSYSGIEVHVFDASLKHVWGERVPLSYGQETMSDLAYYIDSRKNVYLVASIFNNVSPDPKKGIKDPKNYKTEIVKIAPGEKAISAEFGIDSKYIKSIRVYENRQGGLAYAGYYNGGKTFNGVDGIVVCDLNDNLKTTSVKTYELPLEIINQYASGKDSRRNSRKEDDGEAEAKFMALTQVTTLDDGGLLLVGEQEFEITANYPSGYLTTTYYEDILVTRIDASGNLIWMKKLPKRQWGTRGKGGMSFYFLPGNGSYYFLFLDHKSNVDLSQNEVPKSHSDGAGGFLMSYRVDDKTGEVKKILVLNTRDVNETGTELVQFSTTRMTSPESQMIVFEAYKRPKEDVLVRVALEKKE